MPREGAPFFEVSALPDFSVGLVSLIISMLPWQLR